MNHQNCRELVAELSEYVEGTLSDTLCVDLERHLSSCENCRVVVDTLRKTVELYHETGAVEEPLPDEVRERLFLRLNLDDYLKE